MGKIYIGTNTSGIHGAYLGNKELVKIYAGEHLVYIKSPYIYKWVLNEDVDVSKDFSYDVLFMSDSEEYDNISAEARGDYRVLAYNFENTGSFPYNANVAGWLNFKWRSIYFKEKPTGDLLAWLMANGVKEYDVIPAGTYKFKDNVNLSGIDITEPIEYKYTYYGQVTSGMQMNIYSNTIYYKGSATVTAFQGTWQSTAQTITLETDQPVGHDYYQWFMNNIETQLSAPQNVKVAGTVVSWDAVTNAQNYDVYVDDTLYENTTGAR